MPELGGGAGAGAGRAAARRGKRESGYGTQLLDEALALFANGEPDMTRSILRDLVHASFGFERLARLTGVPAKSLHRMLSSRGNPSMDNLSMILGVLCKRLGVKLVSRPRGAGR